MKAGKIFKHPTKKGGVVKLKAIEELSECKGCIFMNMIIVQQKNI